MGNHNYSGRDISRVKKFIVSSTVLGRYETFQLLDYLAIIERDHVLRLNRERQKRYQNRKAMKT